MMDNTGTKVKFLKARNSYYVVIASWSTDFSYPGPAYFWLHLTNGLCNHTSDVTDRFQMDVIL